MTPDRSLVTRCAGAALCTLGLFVLTGWMLGDKTMVRIVPDSVAISINTALMFVLAGLCLVLNTARGIGRLVYRLCAWTLVVLAGAILCEHLFDIDLRIDLAAVHNALGDGHQKPGRTAPNACLGFLFAGIVFNLSAAGGASTSMRRTGMLLAALTFLLGFSGLLGYLLQLDAMYRLASLNRMATFTATGITVLGTGLWTLHGYAHPFQLHRLQDSARRITWLAAALLIVFAMSTAMISFAILRDGFVQSATDNHMNEAISTASGIASLLDDNARLSASVARRSAIVAPLLRLDGGRLDQGALEELSRAGEIFAETGFSAARIVNNANDILFAFGQLDDDAGLQVAYGGADDQASLHRKRGYTVRQIHRIVDKGQLIAIVTTERVLPALSNLLTEPYQKSDTHDILLCARRGDMATCFPSRFFPAGVSLPMFRSDGAPAFPVSLALLGRSGSVNAKDGRGLSVLAGFAPLARHGMAIVVKTETRELYVPLREKLNLLLFAVLGFVTLGALLLRTWAQPLIVQIIEERKRVQAILNNANDAFIAIDADGKITDWNRQAEKLLGHPAAAALGQDLAALIIPPEHHVAHHDGFARFLTSGAGPVVNSRLEVNALHANGHAIPVELSVTSFQAGDRHGASAFLRDLTEHKAAAASAAEHARALDEARFALAQSQKLEAVGKLTGGVAHDFNNVLQVVKGSLELLRAENADGYRVVRRIDTAMGAVERGAKLAAQLLAFARKQPLQPKATHLGRVIRSMEEMLQRAIGDGIEIDIVVSATLWNTLIDPHQLEHVILNLAINARDAMEGRGKLTIVACNSTLSEQDIGIEPGLRPGQFVMLAITDTGAGMSAETMAKAFEPFFSTKPEGQGTGLGLSMTYGFVKQSEGHIKIFSQIGEGSTVRIYLPRTYEQERHAVTALPDQAQGGSETILVVEDELAVQATVVELLSGLGYHVLKADHAAMALEIVQGGAHIDLLFTDVVMPGEMRSTELARRAGLLLPGLKVLFTSGYTQDAFASDGKVGPDVHLLSKPYGREQLARKVRSLLAAAPGTPYPSPLPMSVPAPPPCPAPPSVLKNGSSLKVAFVEDNDDFRMIGAELLAVIGHRVESFRTAEEALVRVPAGDFDVMLSDVSLPGMSGIALARQMRAACPSLYIVLATGYGDGIAKRADVDFPVLSKPFTLEQLRNCLDLITAQ